MERKDIPSLWFGDVYIPEHAKTFLGCTGRRQKHSFPDDNHGLAERLGLERTTGVCRVPRSKAGWVPRTLSSWVWVSPRMATPAGTACWSPSSRSSLVGWQRSPTSADVRQSWSPSKARSMGQKKAWSCDQGSSFLLFFPCPAKLLILWKRNCIEWVSSDTILTNLSSNAYNLATDTKKL